MSFFTRVRTDLGTLAIGHSERGISRILLPGADWHDLGPADLARAGLLTEAPPPLAIAKVAKALQAHIAGEAQDFSGAVLDTSGLPPFLLRVQRLASARTQASNRTQSRNPCLDIRSRCTRQIIRKRSHLFNVPFRLYL